jgi:hypothetical protein
MANGREWFSELIGYVLLFEQANQQGQFQPPYDQTRREIARLLEQEKVTTKREGLPDRDYQDGALLSSLGRMKPSQALDLDASCRLECVSTAQYFQTRNAGEIFDRLERLRPDRKRSGRSTMWSRLGLVGDTSSASRTSSN